MIRTPTPWLIYGSFFLGLVFAVLPLPEPVSAARPYLLAMLLAYWAMEVPLKVGLTTAFVLGLSADLAGRGAVALLARPRLWADFVRVRARSYAGRAVRSLKARRASGSESGEGELIYICVESRYRQRGGGAALLDAFVGEARRSGTQRLHLVTEEDNGTARRFYDRRGWCTMDGSRKALDGRPLVRMERELSGSPR